MVQKENRNGSNPYPILDFSYLLIIIFCFIIFLLFI